MAMDRRPVNKLPKSGKSRSLPLCTAMLLCERVIIDKDDASSAIRIVDTLTIPPNDLLKTDKPCQFNQVNLLVLLKNGKANGKFSFKIVCRSESGKRKLVTGRGTLTVKGPPEGGGITTSPLRLIWHGPGLYWIDLLIDDKTVATTPVRIKVESTETGA